jgi:hypothetical protein
MYHVLMGLIKLVVVDGKTCISFQEIYFNVRRQGSSVGMATGYGLDGPGIESRWRRDFSHLSDRPWGPHSLLYNGYRVFPGGRRRPGSDADLSPLLVPTADCRLQSNHTS